MNRIAKLTKFLICVAGVLLLAGVGFALGRGAAEAPPAAVALEPPALLFDDDFTADAVGQKIQDEAGIAAYYKAPNTLSLESIRPLFNSIELESADYILGSVFSWVSALHPAASKAKLNLDEHKISPSNQD